MIVSLGLYQSLMLLGFPSVFLTCAVFLIKKIKQIDAENKALQRGVQALLRDRLYETYSRFSELGYAPLRAKENFINMYTQYHSLGKNGVMDSIYEKFLDLPEQTKERED